MNLWQPIRIPFLAVTLSGSLLVLGQGILAPPSVSTSDLELTAFPAAVPLEGWQLLGSFPPEEKVKTPEKVKPPEEVEPAKSAPEQGRNYRYTRNGKLLEVEMRHLGSGSKVLEALEVGYQVQPSAVEVRWQEGTGYYGLFSAKQRIHLGACINPRGNSTFTAAQHQQNKMLYDVRLERLLPWLMGQERLIDLRCRWADLSIPLESSTPEAAYQVLEEAWVSWHQWWHP